MCTQTNKDKHYECHLFNLLIKAVGSNYLLGRAVYSLTESNVISNIITLLQQIFFPQNV